jgi:hypothetical protein
MWNGIVLDENEEIERVLSNFISFHGVLKSDFRRARLIFTNCPGGVVDRNSLKPQFERSNWIIWIRSKVWKCQPSTV